MDSKGQGAQCERKRIHNEAQAHLKEVRERFMKTYIVQEGKKKRH